MERTFQGYCRTQDQARLVLCECMDGQTEIDCDYRSCAYRGGCQIGRAITAWLQDNGAMDSVPNRT